MYISFSSITVSVINPMTKGLNPMMKKGQAYDITILKVGMYVQVNVTTIS